MTIGITQYRLTAKRKNPHYLVKVMGVSETCALRFTQMSATVYQFTFLAFLDL